MSNTRNTPVEALEYSFPSASKRTPCAKGLGSGLRQAEGLVRAIRFLDPATVTITAERRRRGPYGLAGGGAPGGRAQPPVAQRQNGGLPGDQLRRGAG